MANARLKKMIETAAAAGHVMRIEHRPAPPEHQDALPKFWLVCSCGYHSTTRRSSSSVLGTLAWHAGQAAATLKADGVSLPSPEHVRL